MSEEPIISFAELSLHPAIFKVIDEVGYETPSPIQSQSIPPLLAGRDLLGQAQTGTGKTAAFSLPLLSRIDPALKYPQILVLLAIIETPPFCDMRWRPILSYGRTRALSHLREGAGPHWRMFSDAPSPLCAL